MKQRTDTARTKSRDRCFRPLSAPVRSSCTRSRARALHPPHRPPERSREPPMHVTKLLCILAISAIVDAARAQNAPFLNINPSWSPDGQWLVFESRRHGDAELYVIASDGTSERRLTRSAGEDTHPSWSPDGETIVFDSNR